MESEIEINLRIGNLFYWAMMTEEERQAMIANSEGGINV